jgi:phosphonate transport system substrate-binding protein
MQRSFLIVALGLVLVTSLFGPTTPGAEGKTLVIGRVSDNPSKTYKELKPIVSYVVSQLHDFGFTNASVLIAKNPKEMIKFLKEGKIDWVQKGVFQALMYEQQAGMEIMLRSWREGAPDYYTVVFTRNDSGIESLNSMKGKKIAFQDAGSTSAFFTPAAALRKAGLELVELSSPKEKTPLNKVGYAFAGNEISIATWVHRGMTDAGAFHNQDWENPAHNPEAMKKDFKIIYQSEKLPRMVELVRKDLDPNVKQRIKEILLKAADDPTAKEALVAYGPKTAKFDEFKGTAKTELDTGTQLFKYVGHYVNAN